jgi:hypothetical protein
MADHPLGESYAGFLEPRLLANGILESPKLAVGEGNQERFKQHNGLSQAGIQVVVVRIHLSPYSLGIQGDSFGEVIGGIAEILAKVVYHFLQRAHFKKELEPVG